MPSWKKVILSGSDAALNTLTVTNGITGSLFGTASYADNATTATTASHALTASYVNPLFQNVELHGDLTVYGSSSFNYVTSSQLQVENSFISVNVFEPAERFGGIRVYDSGSSTATASLAWDSLHNHWVYENVDGANYSGGMLMSGPRNTGLLGDEPSLTRWRVARSDGGDHLNDTQIYSSGSITQITGSLTVTNGITGSLLGNAATATVAANGGVTSIIAGSGVTLPFGGTGDVTVVALGGTPTIISGSSVTSSFSNSNSWVFNHNLGTRTPVITVFDSDYNQILPQNIQLNTDSSATITFPTNESGFAIASTGGTTGTSYTSSYSTFAVYASSASYFPETDPIFVAKSGSLATTGSNTFIGTQNVTGDILVTGNIIPTISSSYSLGSAANPWKEIYLQSGSISMRGLSGAPDTTLSNINGNIQISAGGMQLVGSGSFNAATGSFGYISGSMTQVGDYSQTGNYVMVGDKTITGSLTLSSGSALRINNGFYVDGQKQFNYGQFSNTQTQSGSANTAYPIQLNTVEFSNGVTLASGSRIYLQNTGIYNIQFSAQLHTTVNQAVDFSIWFAMTGSNIDNSNTDFSIEKVAGGGFQVAALNYLTSITSGSYIELQYSKTTDQGQIQAKSAQTLPTRPATPSTIVTVTQIA